MDDPKPDRAESPCLRVAVEARALVVVGGLPGAGKSTLLRNTVSSSPISVLDTEQVRAWLAALPRMPHRRWYRPIAPMLHRLRMVIAMFQAPGPVVVHHTATASLSRAIFATLGALTSRPCHLIWIDCAPVEALHGQHERGRVRLRSSFARQVRRAPALRRRLSTGHPPRGWRSARMIDRATAGHGMRVVVNGRPPRSPGGLPTQQVL
jgi:AAA domain